MIKTIIAGADLTHALAKQQRFVDEGPDRDALAAHRRVHALELETLRVENARLRGRLRMAKADLRPERA